MRLSLVVLGLLTSIGFAHADVVPPPDPWTVAQFLAGHWRSDKDGILNEEIWMAPKGNLILGMNRTINGLNNDFEFLRIENRKAGVVFVAQPRGGKAVEFEQSESHADKLVFRNWTHDWPQKIAYHRVDDNTLEAVVSGKTGGKLVTQTFTWTLVK
jgi:hypothetical protein